MTTRTTRSKRLNLVDDEGPSVIRKKPKNGKNHTQNLPKGKNRANATQNDKNVSQNHTQNEGTTQNLPKGKNCANATQNDKNISSNHKDITQNYKDVTQNDKSTFQNHKDATRNFSDKKKSIGDAPGAPPTRRIRYLESSEEDTDHNPEDSEDSEDSEGSENSSVEVRDDKTSAKKKDIFQGDPPLLIR